MSARTDAVSRQCPTPAASFDTRELLVPSDQILHGERRQIPGNANSGLGSVPFIANQCQVAGFTSPFGSQNDDAGTR